MSNQSFVLVAVGSLAAKKQAVFTYSAESPLDIGQLVAVNLRREKVIGIVVGQDKKPRFKTSPVLDVLPAVLPEPLVNSMLWALEYYPNEKGSVVRLFTPPDFPPKRGLKKIDMVSSVATGKNLPTATSEQTTAIDTIKSSVGVHLLHGKTGSGKTLVYITLIRQMLAAGKSVVLLVPEISLGGQISEVIGEFVSGITLYNSLQTKSVRRDTWYALAESTQPHLIIGPRSALLLPIKNLGAIIIDEAHDSSYKQQQSPYHTTQVVAATLAAQANIPLVYGSATPAAADYYTATVKNYPILEINERPVSSATNLKASFHIVNTRERGQFTRSNVLCNSVISSVGTAVKSGKQALLLLNRRGTAHLVQCDSCGWQYRCEICDHTLVYHKDSHKAVCHYCEKIYPMITSCPEDSGSLKLLTIGTKFIEEECHKLFPGIQTVRLDTDSVTRDNVLETMKTIRSGHAQIIVGTQLVAKGLDLPLLSVVVVVDASRQASDYLSDEHYYQLLHQVIGRGLRGHQNTDIFVQTPEPSDPLISWAIDDNWQAFYRHELEERKMFRYPPFCFLSVATIERKNSESVEKTAEKLVSDISRKGLPVEVLGPVPTYFRSDGIRWQLILKSPKRSKLIEAVQLLPSGWAVDLDAQTS